MPEQQPPGPGAPPISLLDRVVNDAMDEDYAHAAENREGSRTRRSPSLLWIAVLTLGVLLAAAAAQTQRSAPAVAAERSALVAQIRARSTQLETLQELTSRLRQGVQARQAVLLRRSEALRVLQSRLTTLSVNTGAAAASGPGVRVVVDDAAPAAGTGDRGRVLDTDLRAMVNGLWEAGAEAIAIDGHRLTSLSAIRGAGQAITVDYASLTPPYVVVALGNPDTLPARFLETSAGQSWLDLQSNFGVRFSLRSKESLTVPGDASLPACCRQAAVVKP